MRIEAAPRCSVLERLGSPKIEETYMPVETTDVLVMNNRDNPQDRRIQFRVSYPNDQALTAHPGAKQFTLEERYPDRQDDSWLRIDACPTKAMARVAAGHHTGLQLFDEIQWKKLESTLTMP